MKKLDIKYLLYWVVVFIIASALLIIGMGIFVDNILEYKIWIILITMLVTYIPFRRKIFRKE